MEESFTKEEAIKYLGEICLVKSEFTESVHDRPCGTIDSGSFGKIQSVDIWDGDIKLCLDINGNYYSMNKREFLNHCVILKPEIIAHERLISEYDNLSNF